jgi:CRISPR-associated protein Cas1
MLDAMVRQWLGARPLRTEGPGPRGDGPDGSLLARIAGATALNEGWRRVRANKGGPGADGVTIRAFERHLARNLDDLGEALLSGRYRPGRLRRVVIAKPGGGRRRLAIPGIRDRVAQTAALVVIGPQLDRRMSEASFAYRPGRGVDDAIAAVQAGFAAGRTWTLDGDVTRFFDRVPHRRLIEELAIWLDDGAVLALFALWLRSFSRFGRGIAQGSPVSPLLANLFLHPVDRLAAAAGCLLLRYADDFVALAATEQEIAAAQAVIAAALKRRGLALNTIKTQVVPPGQAFTFLGRSLTAPASAPPPAAGRRG